MIRLIPYSVYEFSAMDRYLDQMRQKNWQYHWRFLCFIRFRRSNDAEPLRCAPCKAVKSGWTHIYKDGRIAEDVRLVRDVSELAANDVVHSSLKEDTSSRLMTNAIRLLACCIFTICSCTLACWGSVAALASLRVQSSLLALPFIVFSAVNELFLAVRLTKIKRLRKNGACYSPWRNTVRYVAFLLAFVLLLVQAFAMANAESKAKNSTLYKECRSTISDFFGNASGNSLFVSRNVLEPMYWQSLDHVGGGDVRIEYHGCLSNVSAENYYAQFQKENRGTEQLASSDGNAKMLTAISGNYYAVACVYQNRIFMVTIRDLNTDEAELLANELIDIFLSMSR